MMLTPCVNIQREPQGGRNFESYSEDPYLASRMAVAYIRGVQSQNVIATVKHFAGRCLVGHVGVQQAQRRVVL